MAGKDVLELPLEGLEIPAAIGVMMQAASNTRECTMVVVDAEGVGHPTLRTDNDRLQLLCEKLEARVEDAIEAASAVRTEPVAEDAPNEEPVEEGDIFLMEDGKVINYKGMLYQLACNERVDTKYPEETDTFCIKRYGHQSSNHEDMYGVES